MDAMQWMAWPMMAALLSALLSAVLYPRLLKARAVDRPGARSNHARRTVTGGGLAIMGAALPLWWLAGGDIALLLGAALLMVVSFRDDVQPLSATYRLAVQFLAVIVALWAVPLPLTNGLLPAWLEVVLLVPLWMWWINLYNFMDGIDELTITQTVSLCAGVAVLSLLHHAEMPREALVLLGATAAFYGWNRHPAKMFMGDSGSVPLGYLTGYLLLLLIASGAWAAALLLPAYYASDATTTLLRRALRGERLMHAHSDHAYQRAVRRGYSHREVARWVLLLNLLLLALALLGLAYAHYALLTVVAGYVMSLAFCAMLHRLPQAEVQHGMA